MTQPYGQQPQQPEEGRPSTNPQEQPSSYPQQQPSDYPQQQSGYESGQPGGYGQQNYPPQAYPGEVAATTKNRFSVATAVLAAIAAILGILSLFVLGWYRKFGSLGGGSTGSKTKFSKLHDAVNTLQDAIDQNPTAGKFVSLGISPSYFSWLGYVLIIAAVVLTFITAAPLGGASVAVKFVSALVALAGLGLTLWALDFAHFTGAVANQIGTTPNSFGDWLKHSSWGAWAMLLAFLLCLVGSLIPPKKVAVITDPAGRY